jgi:glycosyltransferase involved in cell wall biosynthesis
VVTWHEVIGGDWKTWGVRGLFGKKIEKINANLGEHKIAVSEFTRQKLEKISKKSNITTIMNGIPSSFLDIENQANEEMNLLYIGRLEPHKNILDILIPSFLEVLKYHPTAVLRIAGTGSERESIINIANKHPNIYFYETVNEDQKRHLYSISDIFLLVSSREGSGIVVLEANAAGLPVVTIKFPNNSVAHEGIKEGVNGKVSTAKQFVHSILHVYENLHQLKISSRRYSENYTWEKMANKIERVYQKIS